MGLPLIGQSPEGNCYDYFYPGPGNTAILSCNCEAT